MKTSFRREHLSIISEGGPVRLRRRSRQTRDFHIRGQKGIYEQIEGGAESRRRILLCNCTTSSPWKVRVKTGAESLVVFFLFVFLSFVCFFNFQ